MYAREKDMKVQIPGQAWITTQIVMGLDTALEETPNITLKEYVDGQKKKTNIWDENPNFPIYNWGYLLMMAYAFLIVPKESTGKSTWQISSINIENSLKKMTIRKNKKTSGLSDSENLINHMRNSISHANFEIVIKESNIIIFKDYYGKKEENCTFDGDMDINDFRAFLVVYYKDHYSKCYQEFISK